MTKTEISDPLLTGLGRKQSSKRTHRTVLKLVFLIISKGDTAGKKTHILTSAHLEVKKIPLSG